MPIHAIQPTDHFQFNGFIQFNEYHLKITYDSLTIRKSVKASFALRMIRIPNASYETTGCTVPVQIGQSVKIPVSKRILKQF